MPTTVSQHEPVVPSVSVVQTAFVRFAASSALALGIVSSGAVLLSEHVAHEESLRDAQAHGAAIAHGLAAPLVDADVRAGDPADMARLATVLEHRMRDGSVVHVRLWDAEGRVIWSDRAGEIGRSVALRPDVQRLFGTRGELSSDTEGRDRDAAESESGPVVETYVGARDADGVPLVVQASMSAVSVKQGAAAVARSVVPLVIGGLLLLQLAVLPLAMSLARSVRDAVREQQRSARQAIAAAEHERRRIAQDLHDSVVQDLAGIGYSMPGIVDGLRAGVQGDQARATAGLVSATLERVVVELRTLLVDIYPPELSDGGLSQALESLVDGVEHGPAVRVQVRVQHGLDIAPESAQMVYRVAREGLRNVVRHAEATHALLSVDRFGEEIRIRVVDDGRGLSGGGVGVGHFGLRLLADSLAALGGSLSVVDGTFVGAVLTASFPDDAVHRREGAGVGLAG